MIQFAISGLRSGIRGRAFQVILFLGVLSIGIAYLSGSFSPRQPQTVVMDIGFSAIRFSLVLLNLLWVQELVTREIERKTVLLSLAYPVSRSAFLLGKYMAIVVLSIMATLVLGGLLSLAVDIAGGGYVQEFGPSLRLPYWMTLFGLLLDTLVVAAFSLCLSTFSTVSALPLALGAAFAIAGKAMGATVDYLMRGADGDAKLVSHFAPLIDGIRVVLPDLSRLDWRDWPMYQAFPGGNTLSWSSLMGISYIGLILLLAMCIFSRREFS